MNPPIPPHPPEMPPSVRRTVERWRRPLEHFFRIEATSGVVLLVNAIAALVWANSPWATSYEHLWNTELRLGVGAQAFTMTLRVLINDGLMTVFFLLVGLEIRREIHRGALSGIRRAALPVAAALGGMLVPAVIYLAVNGDTATRRGWGVPTATDIAFAVGVLAVMGGRVPPKLRVLLLAVAIIDDIGAIVLIAVFYSGALLPAGFAWAAGGVAGVLVFQRLGIRNPYAYALPGLVLWLGLHHAGIHPTLAGVVIGLMTPARPWYGKDGFLAAAKANLDEMRSEAGAAGDDEAWPQLERIREAEREALAPVTRVQAGLHPWVAFGIMPLFALANAGVSLGGASLEKAGALPAAVGAGLGLLLGKPLGIVLASAACVRLGLCALPGGVTWAAILVVGVVGGIGFTMAIFIADLAFVDPAYLAAAKLGILAGSGSAAVLAVILGRLLLPAPPSRPSMEASEKPVGHST